MTDMLGSVAKDVGEALAPPSGGRPTLTRRLGTVSAITAGPPATVDVTVGGIVIPKVRYLASYSATVGDLVVVDFNGADPLVIGATASTVTAPPTALAWSRFSMAGTTTTSATYVDVVGWVDLAFTKRSTSTGLYVTLHAGAFHSGGTSIDFGVRINATDADVAHFFFNDAGVHRAFSGAVGGFVGLAAGSYTARLRWKTPGGTASIDGNDLFSMRIEETVGM
jgi:hypothetical protein